MNADLLATSSYLAPIFSNSTFRTYIYRFKGNLRLDLTAGYSFPFRKGNTACGFSERSRTCSTMNILRTVFVPPGSTAASVPRFHFDPAFLYSRHRKYVVELEKRGTQYESENTGFGVF